MYQLTLEQRQEIDALSNCATFSAAAKAGIHRNTLPNWRSSDDFREALASAHNAKPPRIGAERRRESRRCRVCWACPAAWK
jgi:hypothetical protein